MPVTATFVPTKIDVMPGAETTVSLRIHNDEPVQQLLQLTTVGDLAEQVRPASASLTLEPGEVFDMPVIVDVVATMQTGDHTPVVQITAPSGDVAVSASVTVLEHAEHTVELRPAESHGGSSGRHVVLVKNLGNTAINVDLHPEHLDGPIVIDAPSSVTVKAGAQLPVKLRVTPTHRFWSGRPVEHPFVVRTAGSDGRTGELHGVYEQRARVPRWLGPAAAGALAALLIGTIVWFAVLRPWVEDTADDAAAAAIEQDRAALRERIDELEAAAAEAQELPLGTPVDFPLRASAAAGNSATDSATVKPGTHVSITDVVFQNPSGAVGTITLERDDEILLQSELANFRDLDRHFVAPFVFDAGSKITLRLDCRTPGPGAGECEVGGTLVGFVDDNG